MSKTKLLLDVAANLSNLADSILAVAEAVADGEPSGALKPETPTVNKEEKSETKAVTLEQVRAVLAAKSHDGFTAEVRALLEKHGASRLSEIDPANYPALLADAEGLK
jgi:putative IMPACT (imprinted ancient) family translation regulator